MNNEIHPTNQDLNDQEEPRATMLEQLEEYLTEGEYDYQLPQQGDIQMGVVIEIGDRGAIVDAGFKRDGIVPASDLDRLDDETLQSIQPGDEIAVAVQRPEDEEGRLILSIYDALVREDWERAEKMMEAGELYEGEVSGFNRGGLLAPFGRIRGFIPASHTVGLPRGLQGDERRERLAEMVGDKVGLKIIEVDRHRRRLIFSQRQARRAWQKMQRERVMEELTEGETVTGTVTGITDFGAFVDLGGADGLIHISELSWGQVDDPREVVEVGNEVEVYVLNLDWERTRIALSLKRLKPNPWSQVADQYEVDELVEGKVTRVLDFGAFVELGLGVEGLLHISEMTGTSQLSPTEILKPGQKVLVKIIGIDPHKQRITLSARQVQRDQWEHWMAEHKITGEEAEPEAPEAEVAEEEAPEAEVAEEEAPEAEAVEEEAPEAEVAEEEAPEAEEEAPEAEASEEEAPEAEAVEEEAPEAEVAEEEAPEAEVAEQEAPEAEAAEEEAPEAEAAEEEFPEPEAVEQEIPEPEAVEQDIREPEAVEEEAPETAESEAGEESEMEAEPAALEEEDEKEEEEEEPIG
ncbi:MAG: S1 RNA-binding domain-containing protein [Chloroflexota bacterium]|nr:S1 RNA-binding domain-containing protein [Chloroflexota bacterium]